MSRGTGKPAAADAEPAGLIICNVAAALPALSHPLMNTEMSVMDVRGERRGEKQSGAALISSQIEQSLHPPPPLRGELVFNIPGHVFWRGAPPQTTGGLWRLSSDALMFLMSKLELNTPLGLWRLMCRTTPSHTGQQKQMWHLDV